MGDESTPPTLGEVLKREAEALLRIADLEREVERLREWQRIVQHMEQPSLGTDPCPACNLHHPGGWACPKWLGMLRARIPELEAGIEEYHEKWTADQRIIDALRAHVERLESVPDYVHGFLWLLDRGVFLRSIEDDARGDYAMRAIRLVAWMANAQRAASRAALTDSDAPSAGTPQGPGSVSHSDEASDAGVATPPLDVMETGEPIMVVEPTDAPPGRASPQVRPPCRVCAATAEVREGDDDAAD